MYGLVFHKLKGKRHDFTVWPPAAGIKLGIVFGVWPPCSDDRFLSRLPGRTLHTHNRVPQFTGFIVLGIQFLFRLIQSQDQSKFNEIHWEPTLFLFDHVIYCLPDVADPFCLCSYVLRNEVITRGLTHHHREMKPL